MSQQLYAMPKIRGSLSDVLGEIVRDPKYQKCYEIVYQGSEKCLRCTVCPNVLIDCRKER